MKTLSPFMLTFLGLVGCSSLPMEVSYPVTYDSEPQSALVVCDGQQKGITPLTTHYQLQKVPGNIQIPSCIAHWVSGTEVAYENYINFSNDPAAKTISVQHPDDNTLAKDMDFDRKQKLQKIEREKMKETVESISQ